MSTQKTQMNAEYPRKEVSQKVKLKYQVSSSEFRNRMGLTEHLGSIDVQLIGDHAPKRTEEAGQDQFISVEEGVSSNQQHS